MGRRVGMYTTYWNNNIPARFERLYALLQQKSGSFWHCQPRLQISSGRHTVCETDGCDGQGFAKGETRTHNHHHLTCMVARSLSLPSVLPRNCVRTCESKKGLQMSSMSSSASAQYPCIMSREGCTLRCVTGFWSYNDIFLLGQVNDGLTRRCCVLSVYTKMRKMRQDKS